MLQFSFLKAKTKSKYIILLLRFEKYSKSEFTRLVLFSRKFDKKMPITLKKSIFRVIFEKNIKYIQNSEEFKFHFMKVLALLFGLFLFLMACKDTKVEGEKGLEDTKDANKDKVVEEVNVEKSIYDFKMTSLAGEEVDFAQFKNKKILIVNVASKCGYTPQYKDLQAVHEQYGDDLAILGFPANNFKEQEPGTDKDIAEFCQKNYGVTFQMFSKISVIGQDQAPLYKWLSTKSANG